MFDDFEDVYVMGGRDPRPARGGPTEPGVRRTWAPDGRRVVYRDSRRGVNRNDEICIAAADGSGGGSGMPDWFG